MAADVDEDRGARLELLRLALEVLEGHAEVVAPTVDKLDLGAGADRGERRRHEGVRRAEHRLAFDARELQCGERPAGPTGEADAGELVPLFPAFLEGLQLLPLGPLLGVEHLGPELEEAGTISMIEADREFGHVGHGCLGGAYGNSFWRCAGKRSLWKLFRRETSGFLAESGVRLPAE